MAIVANTARLDAWASAWAACELMECRPVSGTCDPGTHRCPGYFDDKREGSRVTRRSGAARCHKQARSPVTELGSHGNRDCHASVGGLHRSPPAALLHRLPDARQRDGGGGRGSGGVRTVAEASDTDVRSHRAYLVTIVTRLSINRSEERRV